MTYRSGKQTEKLAMRPTHENQAHHKHVKKPEQRVWLHLSRKSFSGQDFTSVLGVCHSLTLLHFQFSTFGASKTS